MRFRDIFIVFILNVSPILSDNNGDNAFVTQTVYGFLDFTTTIGNTVMVFSPQSAPPIEEFDIPTNIIETKPLVEKPAEDESIKPTKPSNADKSLGSNTLSEKKSPKNNIVEAKKDKGNIVEAQKDQIISTKGITSSSIVIAAPVSPTEEQPTLQIENNVFEYDLLSRQPTEYAEETYRVISNKASSDKPRNRNNQRRTHEITEATAAHEGTTQKSKSNQAPHIKPHSPPSGPKAKKPKVRPSTPLRVLKTTSPTLPKPAAAPHEQKINRQNGSNRSNGKGYRLNGASGNEQEQKQISITESVVESSQISQSHKKSSTRSKPKRKNKHHRSSAGHKNTAVVLATTAEPTRKSFRTKVRPSNVEEQPSTSIYMFKLNRTPGRWQYTTTPKPRVAIRKSTEGNTTKSVDPFVGNPSLNVISENGDLESSGSQNGAVVNNIDQGGNHQHLVETLNVEISTPADFKDTYYELATIKTPYAFQVGGLKKTRFITVTSTIEKTLTPEPTETQALDGPLTENILALSTRMPSLQGDFNVATLKAFHVADNEETPSLDTVVDSFSTTMRKLRTQVLPIIYDVNNETSYVTLTQTYDITSLITLTKTISPLETDIVPLSSFTDFGASLDEAGSEINLELEFGDEDNAENGKDDKTAQQSQHPKFSDIADLFGKSSGNLTAEEIQKIALWKLQSTTQQQQQFPSIMLPSIPQFTPETTLPTFPSIAPTINPFLLPLQQFQTITSSFVHDTLETQTNSKVLKLTFGARTAYTTIFSSAVVPTRATSYITTTIPVQPTPPAFPGYFPPPPYPQYYLG